MNHLEFCVIIFAKRGGSALKLLKSSIVFLAVVLLLWGALVLCAPKDDGIFHVVIDPGHGGKDPGAVVGDIYEKDINLAIALMVRDKLAREEGIKVSMTRENDTFLSLTERADFANDLNADLYVSVHANALDDETYSGIFTFYSTDKPSSKKPAEIIQRAVSKATGAIDRGIRTEYFVVIRETEMPAVLIETGFMTCSEELALLIDPVYQAKVAEGIYDGVLAVISNH